jgi:hypothetical protein
LFVFVSTIIFRNMSETYRELNVFSIYIKELVAGVESVADVGLVIFSDVKE